MSLTKLITIVFSFVLLSACTSLVLKPADFSWPLESVLQVDKNLSVTETRYSFTVNVRELLTNEYGPTGIVEDISLRIIRDQAGYYYLTGEAFRNVYVLEESEGAMKLVNTINIPGIDNFQKPVFNQRAPFIEFICGGEKYLLNKDGVTK